MKSLGIDLPMMTTEKESMPQEDMLQYLEYAEEHLRECGLIALADAVAQARKEAATPPTFEIGRHCPLFRVSHGAQGTWEFEGAYLEKTMLDPKYGTIELEIVIGNSSVTYMKYEPPKLEKTAGREETPRGDPEV